MAAATVYPEPDYAGYVIILGRLLPKPPGLWRPLVWVLKSLVFQAWKQCPRTFETAMVKRRAHLEDLKASDFFAPEVWAEWEPVIAEALTRSKRSLERIMRQYRIALRDYHLKVSRGSASQ